MSPNARQVLPGPTGDGAMLALRERHNERFMALARRLQMTADPMVSVLAEKLQRHELSRVEVLDHILSGPHERIVRFTPKPHPAQLPAMSMALANSLAELVPMASGLPRDGLSPSLGHRAPLDHGSATPLEVIGRLLMRRA